MLAQIDTAILIVAIIAVFGAIFIAYTAIYKHISNSKKHPYGDDIVYKDVCEKTQDCLEGKIDALKELCEKEFKHIESLIKNNGHDKPNVIT